MTFRRRWILAVSTATALDLAVRFAAGFDFDRVMHVEAGLFPLTALVLAALVRRESRTPGGPHAVPVGLTWMFGLGGLRALLWTVGLPLMTANLITLAMILVGVVRWAVRRRHRAVAGSA